MERIAKNIDQLIKFWQSDITRREVSEPDIGYYGMEDNEDGFNNIAIDFNLYLPFEEDTIREMEGYLGRNVDVYKFKNCGFKKSVTIQSRNKDFFYAFDCQFEKELKIKTHRGNFTLQDCNIKDLNCANASFGIDSDDEKKGKVRIQNCELHKINFRNTTFNELADFWSSTFNFPTTFYKTEFNATTVFSSVTFKKEVLFTYTLFEGTAIFGRTFFEKGLDLSQSIIGGNLKLFDLKFNFKTYESEYVGNDNDKFQKYVDTENKIPLINKVTTFQILKNQFAKQGNHIDEIAMRKEEKKAYKLLTQFRKLDNKWNSSTGGDRFILWLNRKSNHFRSDFRNGVSFTVICAIILLSLTLISTKEFWSRICFSCDFDWNVVGYTLKLFVVFLNPTHKIDYLAELQPFLGISYVIDFLGRIVVGYGIYQTIQAFRKFR